MEWKDLGRSLRQFGFTFTNFLKSPVNALYQPVLKEGDDYKNSVVIRKKNHHLYVYDDNGKLVHHQPVATGAVEGNKEKEGDMRTPVGKFQISSHNANADEEYFGDKIHYGFRVPGFTGFGIHGDAGSPQSIGTNASHGCIRCNNDRLQELHEVLGGKAAIGKTVYILDEDDKYKSGGVLKYQNSGTIAPAIVFPKKDAAARSGLKSYISPIKYVIDKFTQSRTIPEEWIDLSQHQVNFEDINKDSVDGTIFGNIFIETENPNTVGVKDSFYNGLTLGDKHVPVENYSRYFGSENGKLKVGSKEIFNPDTLITPVVNKDTPITSTIDESFNLGSLGNKFILYTGSGENPIAVTTANPIDTINRYVSQYNIDSNNPAHIIQLDSGRYAVNSTNSPSEYTRNDLPRKDRIWGVTFK